MNEQVLAQTSMRLFGKDAIYKPDSVATPCRVQVDSAVDRFGDAPVRQTLLTFLVSEIPKYEPRAMVYVAELDTTFVLSQVVDDDGYLRVVDCSRL